MYRAGHLLVIFFCALALLGLLTFTYQSQGPTTVDLKATKFYYALGSAVGGGVLGLVVFWLTYPIMEMLFMRNVTDRMIYVLIVVSSFIIGMAYFYGTELSGMIYPEIVFVCAAAANFYRNYSIQY
jgi:hypothetical protein